MNHNNPNNHKNPNNAKAHKNLMNPNNHKNPKIKRLQIQRNYIKYRITIPYIKLTILYYFRDIRL